MSDLIKSFKKFVAEDAVPTNVVGTGAIKGAASDPPGPTKTGRKVVRRSVAGVVV